MEIRQETKDDYTAVEQVIKDAFATAAQSDGKEHELVHELRSSRAFIPELSLVAVENGQIIGHILFTKVTVGSHIELALAPLSVLPAYQRRGVGLALMAEGHQIAKTMGYSYVIVLGHASYYTKAGYIPAGSYGIQAPFAVPDENFMALKLRQEAKNLTGVVKYAQEFGID